MNMIRKHPHLHLSGFRSSNYLSISLLFILRSLEWSPVSISNVKKYLLSLFLYKKVFDPSLEAWFEVSALRTGRAGGRVTAISERFLCVVGGCDDVFGRAEMLASIEILDTWDDGAKWATFKLFLYRKYNSTDQDQ